MQYALVLTQSALSAPIAPVPSVTVSRIKTPWVPWRVPGGVLHAGAALDERFVLSLRNFHATWELRPNAMRTPAVAGAVQEVEGGDRSCTPREEAPAFAD